jgi:hypothetical protein
MDALGEETVGLARHASVATQVVAGELNGTRPAWPLSDDLSAFLSERAVAPTPSSPGPATRDLDTRDAGWLGRGISGR